MSLDLSGFPNLQAILDGRVDGHYTEWPMVRKELQRLVETAVETAEANILADVQDGGASCKWCRETMGRRREMKS